jgi:hypothetical protein
VLLLHAFEHALDLVIVGDVTLLSGSLPAGRFDFIEDVRCEVGGVMVVDDRRRSGVGELFGDRPTNSTVLWQIRACRAITSDLSGACRRESGVIPF